MTNRPELDALIEKSRQWWATATEAEKEAMLKAQRESWIRGEMNWPKAKFKWINGVKVYDSYEDYIND